MKCKISFWCCLMRTSLARILHSFMNSSFYVLHDLILTLFGDDIVHKDTLFLHELLFCADKGFLLVLFDVDIIHMNIWYLHALLFYVFQDFLLKLVDADIDHKDTLFLHKQFFCIVQDFILMLILPTRILNSFVSCSFVLIKTSLCCCLILTLPTRML